MVWTIKSGKVYNRSLYGQRIKAVV